MFWNLYESGYYYSKQNTLTLQIYGWQMKNLMEMVSSRMTMPPSTGHDVELNTIWEILDWPHHHHQNNKLMNIYWNNGVHPSSAVPDTVQYVKPHRSFSAINIFIYVFYRKCKIEFWKYWELSSSELLFYSFKQCHHISSVGSSTCSPHFFHACHYFAFVLCSFNYFAFLCFSSSPPLNPWAHNH